MNKLLALLIAVVIAASFPLPVSAAKQIDWRDLTIPLDPKDDPYNGLNIGQQQILTELLIIDRQRKTKTARKDADEREAELVKKLAKDGLDAVALKNQEAVYREMQVLQRKTMRKDMNGKEVRIPGYMLPLEFKGEQVSEFLLVPYVGACIHVPPPPPNQIIYVKPSVSYRAKGLFAPIWVVGKLQVKSSTQNVGIVDGYADFDVGYYIEASRIEEYTQ